MKKGILMLSTILLCGFAPKEFAPSTFDVVTPLKSNIVEQEIMEFNQIIEHKLKMASEWDVQAAALFKEDNNSPEGIKLKEEAQLQRMMTLKYKAAIACRVKF